ncbi:MAG: lipase maturation factor family protein [Bryobacteraceae bacterium]
MTIAPRLFLRCLGAVYFAAFCSYAWQFPGLNGSMGIAPVSDFLSTVEQSLGPGRYVALPTLAWINSSDAAIQGLAWAGALLAVPAVLGFFTPWLFFLLWLFYLSLDLVGQDFYSFQWDALLLEAGFAAILVASRRFAPSPWAVWVLRVLLFRLLFCSGAVKLLSGDPTWRTLTALHFHFQTQPLPNPIAWLVQHSPAWGLSVFTAAVLGAELIVPFFIFSTPLLRHVAAFILAAFQLLILLTGNYGYFNWLTLALCLTLVDDRLLRRWLRAWRRSPEIPPAPVWKEKTVRAIAVVLLAAGVLRVAQTLHPSPLPGLLNVPAEALERFYISNRYGLFAVMTTTRNEIVIEASNDGRIWWPYEFPFKPGELRRAPPWIAPFQPRLDWQMWFAALSTYQSNSWIEGFLQRLLNGSPPVSALLERNPFEGTPPRFIRAVLYEYRFTSREQRSQTGNWWIRQYRGIYCPPITLRPPGSPTAPVRPFIRL